MVPVADRFLETQRDFWSETFSCVRDKDGYYWITGRIDDVLSTSGHRIGSAEVEHGLVQHPKVAESAVVGYPHPIKGEGIFCYITLKEGEVADEKLVGELKNCVRQEIGAFATPDKMVFSNALPKTRSGKIMRRILRKIAIGQRELGDVSTLADPQVVEELIQLVNQV